MNKYIVRRDMPSLRSVSPAAWRCNAARSNRVVADLHPHLVWLESMICDDTAYCVYLARSEDVVRRHAGRMGFPVTAIHEVRSVITPDDAEDDATARVRRTYEAAADTFDAPPVGFWRRAGRRSVATLDLPRGARVLDVGCGSGASAIPAADAVGPQGSVIGVDLAEPLLARAREAAADRNLEHVRFRADDMRDLGFPDGHFDAVISVFSLFFAPDMRALLRELWRMVAPGGLLSVTTWGPRLFEPASPLWWRAVAEERPDLVEAFRPWDDIDDPATLAALFIEAGLPAPEVHVTADEQVLRAPDDWWSIVLGSGLRWTADQLGEEASERVRARTVAAINEAGITAVECNTLQAVARRAAEDHPRRI